jgi:hypothetical protein
LAHLKLFIDENLSPRLVQEGHSLRRAMVHSDERAAELDCSPADFLLNRVVEVGDSGSVEDFELPRP